MLPEGYNLALADFTAGLPPIVKDWFFNSNDPKAVEARESVKKMLVGEIEGARVRQKEIYEKYLKHVQRKPGDMKVIGCIDPVYFQDMINRHGRGCWNDSAFIADTKKKSPELFVPD